MKKVDFVKISNSFDLITLLMMVPLVISFDSIHVNIVSTFAVHLHSFKLSIINELVYYNVDKKS